MGFDIDCCAVGFDGEKYAHIHTCTHINILNASFYQTSAFVCCHSLLNTFLLFLPTILFCFRVWALPRARRALIKRYNLIDMSRRSLTYEVRLYKYSKRGFAVAVPGFERHLVSQELYTKKPYQGRSFTFLISQILIANITILSQTLND
jgi:hypothetical protein